MLLIEFYPVKMPGACYDLMRKVAETGGGEANVLKLEPKHFCVFICSEVKFISCVSGRFVGGLLLVSPGSCQKRGLKWFTEYVRHNRPPYPVIRVKQPALA